MIKQGQFTETYAELLSSTYAIFRMHYWQCLKSKYPIKQHYYHDGGDSIEFSYYLKMKKIIFLYISD